MLSDSWYLEVGEFIVDSLNLYTKLEGGYASIRDVTTMELEDHQHSFFLAETYELVFSFFFFQSAIKYKENFLNLSNVKFETIGLNVNILFL
jgi:mannosidase alpha-like ER degradation enhancer 1